MNYNLNYQVTIVKTFGCILKKTPILFLIEKEGLNEIFPAFETGVNCFLLKLFFPSDILLEDIK